MRQKQQEQPSTPMNPPSKVFIQIDQRKWNDILAVNSVKRESLAWKISKKVTVFPDIENFIEKLTEQFVGVLCYLCYDVTSTTKVLEFSQIFSGRGFIHKGSSALRRLEQQSLENSCHPKSLRRRSD